MLIASGVKALAWLKKEEEDDEQNRILAGCRFATLALLAGDFGGLVGWGSARKGLNRASKSATVFLSQVIVVLLIHPLEPPSCFVPSLHMKYILPYFMILTRFFIFPLQKQ